MVQTLKASRTRCRYCEAPRAMVYRINVLVFGRDIEIPVCEAHAEQAVADGYTLLAIAPPPPPLTPAERCPVCRQFGTHECWGYPIYEWWDEVPANLKTKTQLYKDGLKPGAQWRARIQYGRGRRERDYALYDVAEATAKKPPTSAQLAALEAANRARRTCHQCGKVVEQLDQLSSQHRCWPCAWAAALAMRTKELEGIRTEAQEALAASDLVLLDTETTSLDGEIVEVAVINAAGDVLLNTLVRPVGAIEPGAGAVHGITETDVATAPTITELTPQLEALLAGRTVAAYNASFDRDRLRTSFAAVGDVPAWLKTITWHDLMVPWSTFQGSWSERRESYRWQPLYGSHRALGDALAALEVLQRMATATDETVQAVADETCAHYRED